MAGNDIKLSIFNGNGLEDPEQHWFQCESIWIMWRVQYEGKECDQMITTLRGCALDWYMKFSRVPIGVTHKIVDQIRAGWIDEFRNPTYESQCITKIKEIKKLSTESVWEFDQIFKTLMDKVSFQMSDVQQKKWFIAVLLPHIWILLMQQNILSQTEALEITMKLECSPIGEIGARMM